MCICKKLLSGFVILLLLFVMGMFRQAQAIPVDPPVPPVPPLPTLTIERLADVWEKIESFMPDIGVPAGFYRIEALQIGDYEWEVNDGVGRTYKGDDFSIYQPDTRVRFAFNRMTLETSTTMLPVPEPSSMILIASLLIGFVGVKKGQKLS